MSNLDRIEINPLVSFGKPVIKGTRHSIDQILLQLSGGTTTEEFLKDFPNLKIEDIHAALEYAAYFIRQYKSLKLTDTEP